MEAPAHQFTVEATRREDPHEEPRRQQWRAGAEREHPSRRQRVRKSFLLVLVFSATVFAILRRALSLVSRSVQPLRSPPTPYLDTGPHRQQQHSLDSGTGKSSCV